MEKESPIISVIIPVYNAGKYLVRCLDSVIFSSCKNIEIIVINDGSTDNSGEICNEYAIRDKRIQVIHQKNSGAATARNAGLKIAAGKYIGFVDSDDYIDADFYEKLYLKAIETNSDIVKGQRYELKNGKPSLKWIKFSYKKVKKISRFSSNIKIKKNRGYFYSNFWAAIYRHDFLKENGIDFPVEIVTGQDIVFLTKSVCLANKIEFVDGAYYNYFRRADSLDSPILDNTKIKSKISSVELIIDFINSINLDTDTYCIIFKRWLKYLLRKVFYRCSDVDTRLTIIEQAADLHKKCKYPEKCKNDKYLDFLSNNDAKGLFLYLLKQE
jgi:Glycosyltransferases, probably involved in cell wall biogenesis